MNDFSDVLVINDHARCGVFGEPVLWTYLIEDLGCRYADLRSMGAANVEDLREKVRARYLAAHERPRLVVQNATFHPLFFPEIPTVAMLQDDFRTMGGCSVTQDPILDHAFSVVTNTQAVRSSYSERAWKTQVIPIGVDTWFWDEGPAVRSKRLAFVGDATATKGFALAAAVVEQLGFEWEVDWIFKRQNASVPRGRVFVNVRREAVREILQAASVMLVTSPVETQCIAACEALACGAMVVSRPVGIFVGWNRPGAIVVPSPTAERLASACLVADACRSEEPAAPRDALFAAELTREVTVARWREVLSRALEGGSAPCIANSNPNAAADPTPT